MMALVDTVRDAIRWFRGEEPVHPEPDEINADPTRIWLRDQETASRASAQRQRDWLERKLVYRRGVEE